jgi:hypothetical protein
MMITVATMGEMALLPLRLAVPILSRDYGTCGTFSYPLLKLDMDCCSTGLKLLSCNGGTRQTTAESLDVTGLPSIREAQAYPATVPKEQRLVTRLIDRSKFA